MHIMAFNGSPRKTWNTGTLVSKALEGAASAGAETTLVHLYDLAYQGCVSCLACKRQTMHDDRRCITQDALTPILHQALQADALILGSPVYFYGETSGFRAFMERLLYPWLSYESDRLSYAPRNIPVALIYTMGLTHEQISKPRPGYPADLVLHCPQTSHYFFDRVFGSCECFFSYDTLQVEDYSKYSMSRFNADAKLHGRQHVFPEDCRRAFDLGARLARGA